MSYKTHTLKQYLDVLASRAPVPGGGSAAALTAALGCALIAMVTEYSIGKGATAAVEKRMAQILKEATHLREEFLKLVDLDAQAYLDVVKTRQSPEKEKKAAQKKAQAVPLQVCRLAYKAVGLTPFIVQHGNKNLLADIEVANELLLAAFNSAITLSHT